jgi:hypothetical protein
MTISVETNKKVYAGDDATVAFDSVFEIFDDDDILVELVTDSTSAVVTQVKDTDYTVGTITAPNSNVTITMTTAPATGESLVLRRNQPQLQSTDYIENDNLPAQTIENDKDKIVLMVQELSEKLERAFLLEPAQTLTTTIARLSGEAGNFLSVNTAEDGFTWATPTAAAGALANIVEDVTPQWGANMDPNGFGIAWPGATITDCLDEDTMASDSATAVATQQSIKAYVDTIATVTAASTNTFTNKTLDADGTGNVITNIGSSEVKSEVISGQTEVVVAAGDSIIFGDADDSNNLKRDTVQGVLDLTEGWELISSATASSDATIDFTGLSSSHKIYRVVLTDIVPASDGFSLNVRTSTDGGSTFDAGASDYAYYYQYHGLTVADDTLVGRNTGTTNMFIANSLGTSANESLSGYFDIYMPSEATYTKCAYQVVMGLSTGDQYLFFGSNIRLSAADVDAIRFLMSSGNIASGTFTLYGLKA